MIGTDKKYIRETNLNIKIEKTSNFCFASLTYQAIATKVVNLQNKSTFKKSLFMNTTNKKTYLGNQP